MLANLKRVLKLKHISYEQVGNLLGISRVQTVSDKMNGKSTFSANQALKIKVVLLPEYDFNWLFEDDGQICEE